MANNAFVGDVLSGPMVATTSRAPILTAKRARSTESDVGPRQCPRHDAQMINTLGISGNASVLNVGGDHITHVNDGLGPETHAVLESIEQRLMVVHDAVLDDKVDGWLSAPDVSQNLNAALQRRQAGTGTWFLDGADFEEWMEQPDLILCLYGSPGCGKTVLCASIIEHVRGSCTTGVSGWAYFFFDSRNANKGLVLYENFLRSVLAQLCSRCGGTPKAVKAIYQAHGNGREQPSIKALEETLRQVIEAFDDVYIMVDGLDESENRIQLLQWIENMAKWNSARCHFLTTSRPEPDIKSHLDRITNTRHILLHGKTLTGDIILYVDERLSHNIYWSAPIRVLIKATLVEGADGMFRWVAMQIDSLQTCMNAKEVKEMLKTLPKDLEETYEQILARSPRRRDLLQMLHWLAFSARALRLEEIAEVPSVDFNAEAGPRYDADLKYSNPRIALAVCSGLVTETDGIVKLAHFSVKEYLLSDRIKIGAAAQFAIGERLSQSVIAQTCIAYLLIFNKPDSIQTPVGTTGPFPLHLYAAEYTDRHLHSAGKFLCPALQELLLDLLLPAPHSKSALVNWGRIYDLEDPWWGTHRLRSADKVAPPIYYASLLGLQNVVERLLQRGTDVNIQGGQHGTALRVATYNGRTEIAKLLLEHGADPNIEWGIYGTALQRAADKGHTEIVDLLLEYGADPNIEREQYRTALQAAAASGHIDIVKILLEHGTDPNMEGRRYGIALQAAADNGRTEIAKLLLEHGADPNVQGGQYGTALQVAAASGRIEIVKLLLEHGADPNIQEGGYGTAFQAAAAMGHIELVKVLLESGANVNIQRGGYGTALQAAAYGGHTEIAKLILEGGAVINICSRIPVMGYCSPNMTALQVAESRGHTETQQLLRISTV